MTSKNEKSPLQDLLNHVLEKGKKSQKNEDDRRREGTYTNGFKNDIVVSVLERKGYTVEGTRINWQTFCLAADGKGSRYALKVLRGQKVIFEATREGASETKKFGAEERYIGTDTTEEGEWKVVRGKLPKELETVPA